MLLFIKTAVYLPLLVEGAVLLHKEDNAQASSFRATVTHNRLIMASDDLKVSDGWNTVADVFATDTYDGSLDPLNNSSQMKKTNKNSESNKEKYSKMKMDQSADLAESDLVIGSSLITLSSEELAEIEMAVDMTNITVYDQTSGKLSYDLSAIYPQGGESSVERFSTEAEMPDFSKWDWENIDKNLTLLYGVIEKTRKVASDRKWSPYVKHLLTSVGAYHPIANIVVGLVKLHPWFDTDEGEDIPEETKKNFKQINEKLEEIKKNINDGFQDMTELICSLELMPIKTTVDVLDVYWNLLSEATDSKESEEYMNSYIKTCEDPQKTPVSLMISLRNKLLSDSNTEMCLERQIKIMTGRSLKDYDRYRDYIVNLARDILLHQSNCHAGSMKGLYKISHGRALEILEKLDEGRERVYNNWVNNIDEKLVALYIGPQINRNVSKLHTELKLWTDKHSIHVIEVYCAGWCLSHMSTCGRKSGWKVMQKDLGNYMRLFVSYKEQKQIDETYSYSEEMCDFKWERNKYEKSECNGKPVCARYWDKWGWNNDCAPEKHCLSVWHEFHENLKWANPGAYNKLFGLTNNGCTPWFFGTSNNGKILQEAGDIPTVIQTIRDGGKRDSQDFSTRFQLSFPQKAKAKWTYDQPEFLGCADSNKFVLDSSSVEILSSCPDAGFSYSIESPSQNVSCTNNPDTWIGAILNKTDIEGKTCVNSYSSLAYVHESISC